MWGRQTPPLILTSAPFPFCRTAQDLDGASSRRNGLAESSSRRLELSGSAAVAARMAEPPSKRKRWVLLPSRARPVRSRWAAARVSYRVSRACDSCAALRAKVSMSALLPGGREAAADLCVLPVV